MIPHQITLDQAIAWTKRFRNNPGADLPLAETFDAKSVVKLLSQPGAVSFRIYLGRKEDDSICSILVAADADGRDILPKQKKTVADADDDDDGILLEDAFRCPTACPPSSPLN